MSQLEARYRAQFVALDELITRIQSTSSYLAQQLANH
jgi:flagellar hook-associated protein 2